MTLQTLARAIKMKKPAVIKDGGAPRYVVLDWATYQKWQEEQDEFQDYLELRDSKVREHIREGTKEYLSGKSRPMEEFLAELDVVADRSRREKKRR